jgi:hypothetical protein
MSYTPPPRSFEGRGFGMVNSDGSARAHQPRGVRSGGVTFRWGLTRRPRPDTPGPDAPGFRGPSRGTPPSFSRLTACLNEVAESADFSDNAAPIRRCRDWSNAVFLTHPFFEPLRRRIMGILLGFLLNRRYTERTVSISGDGSQRMPG